MWYTSTDFKEEVPGTIHSPARATWYRTGPWAAVLFCIIMSYTVYNVSMVFSDSSVPAVKRSARLSVCVRCVFMTGHVWPHRLIRRDASAWEDGFLLLTLMCHSARQPRRTSTLTHSAAGSCSEREHASAAFGLWYKYCTFQSTLIKYVFINKYKYIYRSCARGVRTAAPGLRESAAQYTVIKLNNEWTNRNAPKSNPFIGN